MMQEYRVVRKTIYNGDGDTDIDFLICLVFYDSLDGSIKFIDTAECVRATDIGTLHDRYRSMGKAFSKPILDFDTRKELTNANLYQV